MTSPTGYTAEEAVARDLLIHALNGGASVYRAHVVSVDDPPKQVRVDSIHPSDRSLWGVDLDDITRAVAKLIEHPEDCAEPGSFSEQRGLPHIRATLAADHANGARRDADLAQADADYGVWEYHELIAHFVLPVAISGGVIR